MSIENNIEICTLFDTYGNLLTNRQQEVIKDYYFFNTSLSEIAEMYEISRQAVRDMLVRSVSTLQDTEKKLGLVARNTKAVAELQQMIDGTSVAQKERIEKIISLIKE